jgi:hypothetical protein
LCGSIFLCFAGKFRESRQRLRAFLAAAQATVRPRQMVEHLRLIASAEFQRGLKRGKRLVEPSQTVISRAKQVARLEGVRSEFRSFLEHFNAVLFLAVLQQQISVTHQGGSVVRFDGQGRLIVLGGALTVARYDIGGGEIGVRLSILGLYADQRFEQLDSLRVSFGAQMNGCGRAKSRCIPGLQLEHTGVRCQSPAMIAFFCVRLPEREMRGEQFGIALRGRLERDQRGVGLLQAVLCESQKKKNVAAWRYLPARSNNRAAAA